MADTISGAFALPGALTTEEKERIRWADAWFEAHREEFIADLIEWVKVPSVSDDTLAAPGAPFGPEVANVFERVLARATELGFTTETHEGYAISVLSGKGEQEIGLVSHLDVVPAGENWTVEPYEPFARDGFVIGRGASDNKGPALVDLYLLRAFRELGTTFAHGLRIIYGGAEETGMADLEYYTLNAPVPRVSLITDGGFPVNYAQKGGLDIVLHIPAGPVLSAFRAGVARNAVPATASILIRNRTRPVLEQLLAQVPDELLAVLTIQENAEGVVLTARGQSGHSAFPEKTQNAIPLLLRALVHTGLVEGADLEAARTVAKILQDPWGTGAGTVREDADTGKLTQNGGLVIPAEGGFDLHIDIRYPVSADADDLRDTLAAAIAPLGGTVSITRHARPVYIDREGTLVKLLQDTFDTVAETTTEPFSMGGGTHARVLPRSITFGPGFGRRPDLKFRGEPVNARPDFIPEGHGSPHGPDEFVNIENLKRAFLVYIVTVPRLDRWLQEGLVGDV